MRACPVGLTARSNSGCQTMVTLIPNTTVSNPSSLFPEASIYKYSLFDTNGVRFVHCGQIWIQPGGFHG